MTRKQLRLRLKRAHVAHRAAGTWLPALVRHERRTPKRSEVRLLCGDGCLSGTLGVLPIQLSDDQGTIENAVVRMTVSPAGFSDGVLGGTVQGATAEAILDAITPGYTADLFFDINADLSGEAQTACDALSLTLEVGGGAVPERSAVSHVPATPCTTSGRLRYSRRRGSEPLAAKSRPR